MKSTLLNSLLERPILGVDITPKTALATEIRYVDNVENEHIEAITKYSTIDTFQISDFSKITEKATDYQYIKLYVHSPIIQQLYPLVLVDMPGFVSPLDEHNKAIKRYIDKGAHFMLLINATEGAITEVMEREIEYLISLKRSVSVFLS